MEPHYQLSDSEFEAQFEAGSLDPTLFSHEAHLRLAWIHVTEHGTEKACTSISKQIKSFATAQGASDKYNETVTIAAVKAVDHFIRRSGSDNFKDFIAEFPQLKTKFKELLGSHYSYNIFQSGPAKKSFQDPDLAPFD